MKTRKKKHFWDNDEMGLVLIKFKSMYAIDKKAKTAVLTAPPSVKAELYDDFLHGQLGGVVKSAALIIDRSTNNKFASQALSDDLINICIAYLIECILFNWDVSKPSFNYLLTCARSFLVDYHRGSGRGGVSGDIGKTKYTHVATTLPEHLQNLPPYHRWKISDWVEEQSPDYTWSWSSKANNIITINKPNVTIVSQDETPHLLEQLTDASSDWLQLCDVIDWQILSEYIPDTEAAQHSRDLAYHLINLLKDIVAGDWPTEQPINQRTLYSALTRAVPYSVNRDAWALAKDVLRQAFEFYAEDEM